MIHARGLPMLLHFYWCSDWHSSMNSSLLSVIYRTRLHFYAMREQSGLACTLIGCNGWNRVLRHTFFDWQFMRVACPDILINPWADTYSQGITHPWDVLYRFWLLMPFLLSLLSMLKHQRKGRWSPRDATDTLMLPSYERHKHYHSFESYAVA